ncbi:MAG: sulfotransferase [Acetobacteraceae bacterium]|nr:sulfotransferase [Acetobacteraceae bacterium]
MNHTIVSSRAPSTETRRRGHLAAIVDAPKRRPIVLVLGMHRSGTSLCSHILGMLGVDMTDDIAAPGTASLGRDNPRGHWERHEIVEFHTRVLRIFNRDYHTPFHDLPLPVAWWADPRVGEVRREIVEFLKERMGERLFGFKDPRTVRMMPIWHQIIKELRLTPKIVFCLRNPAQVARSLTARDGVAADAAEYRWFSYVMDFFRYTQDSEFCTVEYESWFDEPSANLGKLLSFLDLRWDQTEWDLDLAASGIVDRELRHDDPHCREARHPLVRSVYKLALRAGHDPASRTQIQSIASQFISFQQFHGPLYRAFENAAIRAATLPQMEQDAAALRIAVSEREALIEAVNARVNAAEERLAVSIAEGEALRARIGVIERERDMLAGALEAARAELTAAQAELLARMTAEERLHSEQLARCARLRPPGRLGARHSRR